MILERETTTAELMLTNLAHQPLLSFTLWKTAWSPEIQWSWMFRKACHDCWFFCLVCIHFVSMNQSLYLFFQYLCQGAASLECYYFVLEGHKKRRCFLSKRRRNGIYLRVSILNSLALLINKLEQHESKTSQDPKKIE